MTNKLEAVKKINLYIGIITLGFGVVAMLFNYRIFAAFSFGYAVKSFHNSLIQLRG